jgi:hypothetical protein
MVTMITLSAVDFGFKPPSGQTKNYKIGICSFSAKQAALRRKSQGKYINYRLLIIKTELLVYN